MGKGNRNRDAHLQEVANAPQKRQEPKTTPKWVKPLVSIVLLIAVLVGAVAWVISANGIIERNRVIVKSTTGKYDLTQQMATYLVWQSAYSTYYSLSEYYLSYSTSAGTTTSEQEKELNKLQFALGNAQTAVVDDLRNSIESALSTMTSYVALCDKATEEGFTLTEADQEEIQAQIDWLWNIKDAIGYYAASKNKFLSVIMVSGMKQKDVEDALELMTLAEKFKLDYQAKVDAGLAQNPEIEAILANYRDNNLADFYSSKYYSYVSENEELAKLLATATGVEDFRSKLVEYTFNKEYLKLFNQYTVQVGVAADDLAKIDGKKDNENGTAWSEGVAAITDWTAKSQTYTNNDSFALPIEVKDWMFMDTREAFDSVALTTLDAEGNVGVYLLTIAAVNADKTVTAHVKEYPTADGASYDGKDNFKELVLAYVKHELMDTDAPEVDYKSAAEQAADLKAKLTAEGADVDAILAEVTWEKMIDANTSAADKNLVPSVITKALDKVTTTGAQIVELDFDTTYFVYVTKIEGSVKEYRYVAMNSGAFHQIGDELVGMLEESFPTEKSIAYTESDDVADVTFAEWASELSADGKLPFVRQVGEAKWFAEKEEVKDDSGKTKTDDKGNAVTKDVYAAYVISKVMDFDTAKDVLRGGYMSFATQSEADALLSKLSGKTYADLIFALYAEGGTTSYDKNLEASSITDATVKSWFESADRQANELAVVTGADGKYYVVALVDKLPEWKANARNGYVEETLNSWVDALAANYTADEKVLDKIGEKATTTTAA